MGTPSKCDDVWSQLSKLPCKLLPFFQDLYLDISRSWKQLFPTRITNSASFWLWVLIWARYVIAKRSRCVLLQSVGTQSTKVTQPTEFGRALILTWHIKLPRYVGSFSGIEPFLPDLQDCHVVIRTDNMSVVSYISQQGDDAFMGHRTSFCPSEQCTFWVQIFFRGMGYGLASGDCILKM